MTSDTAWLWGWRILETILIPIVGWAAYEVRSMRLLVTDMRREVIDHLEADDRRFGMLDDRAADAHARLLELERRRSGR